MLEIRLWAIIINALCFALCRKLHNKIQRLWFCMIFAIPWVQEAIKWERKYTKIALNSNQNPLTATFTN